MGAGLGRPTRAELITRWIARGLTLIPLGGWLVLFVMSWIRESIYTGEAGLADHAFWMLIAVAFVVLVFFFELAAGVTLIIVGLVLFHALGNYDLYHAMLECIPMWLIGLLYVDAWRMGRRRANAQRIREPVGTQAATNYDLWTL